MIDVADHYPRALGQAIEDFAPRVDQHAVAVGFAAILMPPALRNRQHVALILDGAGTQQDLPMGAPGNLGKGGGNHQ